MCALLGSFAILFPEANGEQSHRTAAMSILLLLVVTGVAISACVEVIRLQPHETRSLLESVESPDSDPLLFFRDLTSEEQTPEPEAVPEFLVPEGATIIDGPRRLRNIDVEKIIFVSGFVARLTQDFWGGKNHQIQLLKKGDIVTISAIKRGKLCYSIHGDAFPLTHFHLGFWLASNLEDSPKQGWIENSYLEFVDLEADPIVYRDKSQPANNTVWYGFNPLRQGTSEGYKEVEREGKALMQWENVTMASFMHGYVTIGLREDMRDVDLEKLPRVIATWPARYNFESFERLRCPCNLTGGARVERISSGEQKVSKQSPPWRRA